MEPTIIKTNKEGKQTRANNDENSRKRQNPFRDRKEEKERRQKKKARIIIRNINYKCSEADIKKHFEQWGEVEEISLLKRPDGRLVGCAFVQFASINQATKAILKGNNKELKGRAVYVDWAVGKNEYMSKKEATKETKKEKVENDNDDDDDDDDDDNDGEAEQTESKRLKVESENSNDENEDAVENSEEENDSNVEHDESDEDLNEEDDEEVDESEDEDDASVNSNEDDSDNDDKKDSKLKNDIEKVKKEKHISNDVKEGCTIFLKNVPFDVEENDLRKLCRKYGPIYYAIINREMVSGHSKGTAFVKFKSKESADLCLQAGSELVLMDQVIEPYPALSKEEVRNQANEKTKDKDNKDSRNLYLAREGLIMSGAKAADRVSASDMTKRHELEKIKTQVLKNLNRFVSRNRLSIHNLPLNYDDEKLKQMAITYTGFKPHECRVMRENKITAEDPKGKSKGFGFLSFNTHKNALEALRKLNNNPKVFSNQHRPIVAFSIEDRAVHKIKEKRTMKSKQNNPTYQEKLERQKQARKDKQGPFKLPKKTLESDNKTKLQQHIKNLEEKRAKTASNASKANNTMEENFVGTAAKPGTSLRMRSNKKINEQAQEHRKRVRENKRKEKHQKIRQIHLAERRAEIRPKQGKKVQRDDLENLVNKYKKMLNAADNSNSGETASRKTIVKKPKRTKWYKDE